MNNRTLLYRQVHPAWLQNGRITSQVFRPTPKDQKRLSIDDGDLISAEDSWKHFSQTLGHNSKGVMAVTLEECTGVGLQVVPDPIPHLAHAFVDFTPYNENETIRKAKQLKQSAEFRGWQYHPDDISHG